MSQVSQYVGVANALLWLGNNKGKGTVKFNSPVFFVSANITQEMMAVTYHKDHQKWLILTDSADELNWFSEVPWRVIMIGDDFIMPVCQDIEIPARYRTSNTSSIPKFALKMGCITPVATALMQQKEVLLGRYAVEGGVATVEFISDKPIRILKRVKGQT